MNANFSQAQLEAAFSAVQNPADWRAPVDSTVSASLLSLARAAVIHFTGAEVVVTQTGPDAFRLTSVGYRNGPCGS